MNRHARDPVSLATGLVYLGFVAFWLLGRLIGTGSVSAMWCAAGARLLFGVIGLVGGLRPRVLRPNGSRSRDGIR